MTARRMTAEELAVEFHTDGPTIRKFLREVTPAEKHPGRGSQWQIPQTQSQMRKLTRQYQLWSEQHARLVQRHVA